MLNKDFLFTDSSKVSIKAKKYLQEIGILNHLIEFPSERDQHKLPWISSDISAYAFEGYEGILKYVLVLKSMKNYNKIFELAETLQKICASEKNDLVERLLYERAEDKKYEKNQKLNLN